MVGRGRNAPTFSLEQTKRHIIFLTSGKRSSVPHGRLLHNLRNAKKNYIFRRQSCRGCRCIVRVLRDNCRWLPCRWGLPRIGPTLCALRYKLQRANE
nr:MAG TPA: His-Me finger endonuclease beta4-alpha2 domain [Caudoviricetes sp.]